VLEYPYTAFLEYKSVLELVCTLTLRCEGLAVTAERRDCSFATSWAGSFGSPGEARVAEKAALATASCVVSDVNTVQTYLQLLLLHRGRTHRR
jgi:hypothetical protein